MELSPTTLEGITSDYFLDNDGRAVDIYFRNAFLLDLLMNRQAGIFERPAGGEMIRVPLNYSDKPPDTPDANFHWKHAYGNATVYLTDEVAGLEGDSLVRFVTSKIETAQRTCANWLAATIYASSGDESPTLTGLRALTSTNPDKPYGGLAEMDVVAPDGTHPWGGITNEIHEDISLAVLDGLIEAATISDGRAGKPNVAVTTESLWSKVCRKLQTENLLVVDNTTACAGFPNVVYKGMTLVPDDYCPAGRLFALNTNHIGFAVHPNGFFARHPWIKMSAPAGWGMKILWHGNLVCSNRRAHACHSNLS